MTCKDVAIHLPYPPSINHYYGRGCKGRPYLLPEAKVYRAEVCRIVGTVTPMDGYLAVEIDYWTPDMRRRDIDNILKALLDACTHAGLWSDDKQIKNLKVTWRGREKPDGRIRLRCRQMESMLF